jgi:hypothetical protein
MIQYLPETVYQLYVVLEIVGGKVAVSRCYYLLETVYHLEMVLDHVERQQYLDNTIYLRQSTS